MADMHRRCYAVVVNDLMILPAKVNKVLIARCYRFCFCLLLRFLFRLRLFVLRPFKLSPYA